MTMPDSGGARGGLCPSVSAEPPRRKVAGSGAHAGLDTKPAPSPPIGRAVRGNTRGEATQERVLPYINESRQTLW